MGIPTLDALISSMVSDGTMEDLAELHFRKAACGSEQGDENAGEEEEVPPLTIENFAGLFSFHTALAVAAYAYQNWHLGPASTLVKGMQAALNDHAATTTPTPEATVGAPSDG